MPFTKPKKNRRMFLMAQEKYSQLIKDGKNTIHDSGIKPTEEFDEELVKQGCLAFHRHFFSVFVGMLAGLLSLMYVPSIVKVLDNTRQSITPEKSFLRYLTTLNHVVQWYKLSANERLLSLKKVRRIHAGVAKSNAMTQYDMVLTQWAFISPLFLKTNQMGMDTITIQELDGIRYIFYLVGQALGIQEEYNLCQQDLTSTISYMELIFQNDIKVLLKTEAKREISQNMAKNVLQGFVLLNPFLHPTAFKHWTFELFECPLGDDETMKNHIQLQGYVKNHKLSSTLIKVVFNKILCGKIGLLMRPLFNLLMKVNIYLANLWQNHILHPYRRPFL